MPSTEAFLQALFGSQNGAYRYLGSYLTGKGDYRLHAVDISAEGRKPQRVFAQTGLSFTAVPVRHGPIPALLFPRGGALSGSDDQLASIMRA
jgi:hypothetical protein